MVLSFDATRANEPFLRLPAPFENIIITPPRLSDGDTVVECMNDKRVYGYINGPPLPYAYKDFEFWYGKVDKWCKDGLQQYLEIAEDSGEDRKKTARKWVDTAPVRSLRDVDPVTGEQRYIGDLGFDRQGYGGHTSVSDTQKKELRDMNEGYAAGDERIDWTIGDYLAPSYQGRGIMSAAVRCIIEGYAIPYMNAHKITAIFFEHNIASRRVFEKNGFSFQGLYPDPVKLPESKGGKEIFHGLMRWERKL